MTDQQSSISPKEEFDWPPLESNPQVFSDYLYKIGLAPSFAIGEVFGFDEELLAFLPQPIYGIIVALERLNRSKDVARGSITSDMAKNSIPFYMDQSGTLDNACGIIACLHAILNSEETMILPDTVLSKFQQSTKTQTPAERCQSLETNSEFKTMHKTFALQGQSQTVTSDQSKVQHHFVAFVVRDGKLVELDGTKQGPHVVGDCTDVLRGSIAEIQKRLADGEISDKLSMMTLNVAM
eukprot:CAMPEP_0195304500 /NCGR_PEP_ID=MMETSP0707-20130614/34570_1 /TAXON_ID=33640 /ORGANISM="Asterionellopsis glacialis, Strain CCMP134" /LENGTH=237 /DNA_ID=CAMNT_0040368325 /DNA_START=1 /DNA_END=714 /DNA_ORIENTATION=+